MVSKKCFFPEMKELNTGELINYESPEDIQNKKKYYSIS